MRKCYACGTTESLQHDGKWKAWYHNHDLDDNVLCVKCNLKYFKNPRNKWQRQLVELRRINFLGRRIILSFDPHQYYNRICVMCGNNITDDVNPHHWFYLIIMPWACREELCGTCHRKRHWELDTYSDQHRDPKNGRFISGL